MACGRRKKHVMRCLFDYQIKTISIAPGIESHMWFISQHVISVMFFSMRISICPSDEILG